MRKPPPVMTNSLKIWLNCFDKLYNYKNLILKNANHAPSAFSGSKSESLPESGGLNADNDGTFDALSDRMLS